MKHLLIDLYKVCSYDAPGVKIGPVPGVTGFEKEQKRKTSKFLYSVTGKRGAFIFGM